VHRPQRTVTAISKMRAERFTGDIVKSPLVALAWKQIWKQKIQRCPGFKPGGITLHAGNDSQDPDGGTSGPCLRLVGYGSGVTLVRDHRGGTHAQLARAYNTRAFKFSSHAQGKAFRENADVAVEKALDLNPDLAEVSVIDGLFARRPARPGSGARASYGRHQSEQCDGSFALRRLHSMAMQVRRSARDSEDRRMSLVLVRELSLPSRRVRGMFGRLLGPTSGLI